MHKVVFAMMIAAGLGLAGAPAATAAPVNGAAQVTNEDLLIEPVHCRRWLPHRHMGAKPHGFGFGCFKKARSTRARRA